MTKATYIITQLQSVRYGIFLLLLLFGSCKKAPSGALSVKESSKLYQLSDRTDVSVEDKYHAVVESFAQVVYEALSKQDAEMITHLRTFQSQNNSALDKLAIAFDDWQKDMNDEERMYFSSNLLSKDYTRKLMKYVPELQYRLKNYPSDADEFERMMRTIEMRR